MTIKCKNIFCCLAFVVFSFGAAISAHAKNSHFPATDLISTPPSEPVSTEGRDIATCGNGILEFPEQCDDGNRLPGDGCSPRCRLKQNPENQNTNPDPIKPDNRPNPEIIISIVPTVPLTDHGDFPIVPLETDEETPIEETVPENENEIIECQYECIDTDEGINPVDHVDSVYGVNALGVAFSSTDRCAGPTAVYETICDGLGASVVHTPCPEGSYCVDGACTVQENQTDCTDTDGGSNPLDSVGNVSGTNAIGEAFDRDDRCAGLSAVYEHVCTETGYSTVYTQCPVNTLCDAGICTPIVENDEVAGGDEEELEDEDPTDPAAIGQTECTDTDSGANPLSSVGNVSGVNAVGDEFSVNDSCAGLEAVYEHICTETGYSTVYTQCPDDQLCSGGVCVPCDCN